MKKPFLFLAMASVLVACDSPQGVVDEGTNRTGQAVAAAALETEVRRVVGKSEGGENLWPGFDPLAVPLAVFDGENTVLFRHPSPPGEFTPVANGSFDEHTYNGRHQAIVANTVVELGGVPTATILLDQSARHDSLTGLAAVAVHEKFHAYQRANHPGWVANEADLFVYPTDSPELLLLRRMETRAFRNALAEEEPDAAACWARQAMAARDMRFARLDDAFPAYERLTELNEGLAGYIQARAAGDDTVKLPESGFAPALVRQRAYSTGTAIALLLDRFKPEWKLELAARDDQYLEDMLSAAIGDAETCAFDDDTVARMNRSVREDIQALLETRAQLVREFEEQAGWRVIIEATGGALLMPQGFDPINIETIDSGRVLHTRFLRLGNDAGKLEVMGARAMTTGAGSHPLFNGVKHVLLTGLAEPEAVQANGRVTVRVPGLTLEFEGAHLVRGDETITLQLTSP